MMWERIWISLFISASIFWLALPELALWRASSVSVVGRWAECFLLLVMADKGELDGDREKEENPVSPISRFRFKLSD